ncbi:MAG: HlyD family efflux transporter periplasmic adaptor subunit [Pirellulales bacterium]
MSVKYVVGFLSLLVGNAVLACGVFAQAQEAPAEPILENCLVSLVEEAKVPAREGGVLVSLGIREGDVVARDEVIAKIDDDQAQMEMRRARSEHDQAKARAQSDVDIRYSIAAEEVAEAEHQKALESHSKVPNSVTEVERERLRLNHKKGELQIEQAQLEQQMNKLAATSKGVELEAAVNAIDRRLIKSPLAGVVVQIFPHEGEWMQPGDPLAHVVRTDKLRVEGFVNARQWNAEDVRDRPVTVEVQLAGGQRESFDGRIVFTSPLVQAGNNFRVVAEVSNRQNSQSKQWVLRAGQSARMTIHSAKNPLLPVRKN